MEGTEGNPPDGAQPASDSGEPMTPPDAAPASDAPPMLDSPDSPTPAPDPNADPNQPTEFNPDGTPREPQRPKTLREQAIAAFNEGDDAQARRLLHAHYVFVPKAKDELAKKMAWFPGLMRPALLPRIGIAVQYLESSRDFKGKPMPIGSEELKTAVEQLQQGASDQGGGGGGRRARANEGGGGAAADGDLNVPAGAMEQLRFYTGEFGEIFLETLEEHADAGTYGPVLKELRQETSRQRRASDDPNNPGNAPAPGLGNALDQPDAAAPGSARARRRTGRSSNPEAATATENAKLLAPGVLWLGKADEREQLVKRAEAAAVDILAVFEMNVREGRAGGFVSNQTRLRLLTMKQGHPPVAEHKPEALVNRDVEQWRQKGSKGTDPVDREVDRALEALDKVLQPTALPEALTADRAKKRIADLVAQKPDEPLPVLVEARFYAAKGLLPEEDFKSAALAILGESTYAELQEKAKIESE